jgi:hypothetical protein
MDTQAFLKQNLVSLSQKWVIKSKAKHKYFYLINKNTRIVEKNEKIIIQNFQHVYE